MSGWVSGALQMSVVSRTEGRKIVSDNLSAGGVDPNRLSDYLSGPRYDVFLSFTWADRAQVMEIEAALRKVGLRVFRDSECIDEFEGITAGLVRGLASSTVLLAYYSKTFPTRYACQWELTAAFIAAQRTGNPQDRVLAINPEHNSDHIAPVELEDARYHTAPRTAREYLALAERVRDRVRAVSGPLGSLRGPTDLPPLPGRLQHPRRFVGRYPQLWSIHTALHERGLSGTRPPTPSAAAAVTGVAGTGKTSLVGQYAVLFQEAFPGGVFWTGPFSGAARSTEETLADYFAQVRVLAGAELGRDMTGVASDVLRGELVKHFAAQDKKVLWIVDDLPSGLDPETLNALLIPAPQVRTVLTARSMVPEWSVPKVALSGLTVAESRALFSATRAPENEAERDEIDRLARHCGGHPMVLERVAAAARGRQGVDTEVGFVDYLRSEDFTVKEVLRADVGKLGEAAREILTLASVLSPASISPSLLLGVLRDTLGVAPERVGQVVGDGLGELARHGLADEVDLVEAGWPRRSWRVHPLVAEAAQQSVDQARVVVLARRAAGALLNALPSGDESPARPGSPALYQHARAIAEHIDVYKTDRRSLLSLVSSWSTRQGDVVAARVTAEKALDLGQNSVEALLAAARTSTATGNYEQATRYCERAIELTRPVGDEQNEYRARLLGAVAYDNLCRYQTADALFYDHVDYNHVDEQHDARPPRWMQPDEAHSVQVSRAVGLRLRGRLTAAQQALEAVLPLLPNASARDAVREPMPTAKLELTRLQLHQGKIRAARQTAGEIVAAYQRLGMDSHPVCMDAIGLQAQADLTVDLTEMRLDTDQWDRREEELRDAHDTYRRTLGPDNPRTLAAALQRDLALVSRGRPKQALAALDETERAIGRVLGGDHPLRYRACYGMAQSHGQLKDYPRQLVILQDLLGSQVRTLGPYHPDTLATRLDVGIGLALTGNLEEGRNYVNEAVRHIGDELSWRTELRTRAKTSQCLMCLPRILWETVVAFDRLFGSKKTD